MFLILLSFPENSSNEIKSSRRSSCSRKSPLVKTSSAPFSVEINRTPAELKFTSFKFRYIYLIDSESAWKYQEEETFRILFLLKQPNDKRIID
ncbi:MAG: hypothetical protein Ct9H300mP20_14870 [Gammaproteobacteria bacterium]|nr:MAG: hypothetical protein Ct9H300mP20_14870 [Gammaproteobacteria bacterium]